MSRYTHENVPEDVAKRFPSLHGKTIITKASVPAHVLESADSKAKAATTATKHAASTIAPATSSSVATTGAVTHTVKPATTVVKQLHSSAVHVVSSHPSKIAATHVPVAVPATTATVTKTLPKHSLSTHVSHVPVIAHASHVRPAPVHHAVVPAGAASTITKTSTAATGATANTTAVTANPTVSQAPAASVVKKIVTHASPVKGSLGVSHVAVHKTAAFTHENVPEDISKKFPNLKHPSAKKPENVASHISIKSPVKPAETSAATHATTIKPAEKKLHK